MNFYKTKCLLLGAAVPRLLVMCLTLMAFSGLVHAQQQLEAMRVPDFNEFYIAQSFKLAATRKIYIEDASVEFSQDWLDEFKTLVDSHYKEIIVQKYGKALKAKLGEALTEDGWKVAKKPDNETLLLKPKLVDLNIYAPNESSLRLTIVKNVGRAGVELDFQTPEGESFMKIVDLRETKPTIGSPIVANRSNNLRYFKMLMKDWSEDAVKYLDEVMLVVEDQSKTDTQ